MLILSFSFCDFAFSQESKTNEGLTSRISRYIMSTYGYLKEGYQGNPEGFPAQSKKSLNKPDVQIVLNNKVLRKFFSHIINEKIPLDQKNPTNGDYFYFENMILKNDTERRIVILKTIGGNLKFSFVDEDVLKVEEATIEILPQIRKINNRIYLDFKARLVQIYIDNIFETAERVVAHGINDYLTGKDGQVAITSLDLTHNFSRSLRLYSIKQKDIRVSLSDSAVFVEKDGIVFQANLKVIK